MGFEVPVEKLRRTYDPGKMKAPNTSRLAPYQGIIGQERAVSALKFGLGIDEFGYNVYVAGIPGTGRTTAVKKFLDELAKEGPPPSDWCYVNNFNNQYEPIAIRLPPGKGREFRQDMANLINTAKRVIPKAFQSEEIATRKQSAIRAAEGEKRKVLLDINEKARAAGFTIQLSPVGLLIVPLVDGRPISDQEFMTLSTEMRNEIQRRREHMESDLQAGLRQLRALDEEIIASLEKVDREIVTYAIGHEIAALTQKYRGVPEVVSYLQDVEKDIVENHAMFLQAPGGAEGLPGAIPAAAASAAAGPAPGASAAASLLFPWLRELPFRKYEVNVIVDNSGLKGAPVVLEPNPTFINLLGRSEKEAQFGILSTDFTMIRAGSLHKANGGYLVLPIEELLRNPFSWDGLKMALKTNELKIEEPGERAGVIAIKGLRPRPIPLDAKVVLIGQPYLYQLLYALDPDFRELFKVRADFDTSMPRTEENMERYISFICSLCGREDLKHLDAEAVGKVIEFGSRLASDQEKLSAQFAIVADLIKEANYYASQDKSEKVTAAHVKKAIDERIYRSSLIREKIQEAIARGFLLINTDGEAVGQVNGLSVALLGDFSFGRPSRVTASTSVGRGGIIDIEREAAMGGPIHTKGVMILGGYLSNKYAQEKPLTLSARLVFEQSYEGIEGDSASSTELYAILSSLAEAPVKQYIAVTGSVNQKGEVQAIGGVNEKIEGYYEICKAKGLTGKQGVMIPESNIKNLMLKEEVVDAVKQGKFHIWAVNTIDEGIELLTGIKAGARQPDGTFEEGSINYRVDKRLREMAETMRSYREFVEEAGAR